LRRLAYAMRTACKAIALSAEIKSAFAMENPPMKEELKMAGAARPAEKS